MTQPDASPPEFPRHQILVGRGAAERVLFGNLEQTARQATQAEDFGRRAVIEALDACVSFLYARGLSGQAMKPLLDMRKALADVTLGILPELFDPKAVERARAGTRKRSRSSASDEIRVYAAACLGALMEKGIAKSEAKAKVARCAQDWPRFSSGTLNGNTVANWRDRIIQAPVSDLKRRTYDSIVRGFTVGPSANRYLDEVLRDGPPLTGAIRKAET
jgi:hypothetical protein